MDKDAKYIEDAPCPECGKDGVLIDKFKFNDNFNIVVCDYCHVVFCTTMLPYYGDITTEPIERIYEELAERESNCLDVERENRSLEKEIAEIREKYKKRIEKMEIVNHNLQIQIGLLKGTDKPIITSKKISQK